MLIGNDLADTLTSEIRDNAFQCRGTYKLIRSSIMETLGGEWGTLREEQILRFVRLWPDRKKQTKSLKVSPFRC